MTVVLVQDVEGGSQEIYEQVEAKLHGRTDPPAGRILHTAGPTDTGWRVVDVWSRATRCNASVTSGCCPRSAIRWVSSRASRGCRSPTCTR